jgi:hypothetical protein
MFMLHNAHIFTVTIFYFDVIAYYKLKPENVKEEIIAAR